MDGLKARQRGRKRDEDAAEMTQEQRENQPLTGQRAGGAIIEVKNSRRQWVSYNRGV